MRQKIEGGWTIESCVLLLGQHQNPTPWIMCRLYKGMQQVSKMGSKFDGNEIIIQHRLTKAFPHTMDSGNPKRTQLRCLLVMYSVYILLQLLYII